uniref:TipJ family phage tail tip protein n=1 Tax=Moraxella canis TaxID=90239 RepID=UPI0006682C19
MQVIGAKKRKQAAKPYIMPDNMQSGNEVGVVYGLGEGEILGLVDGGRSIYLDGTPLINDNGGENFGGVLWEMRHGTIDQEHLHGFPAVENETSVNVELRHDRPFVRQLRNTKLSAAVIRIGFGAIFTAKDNGDRVGHTIEYAVDVQTDGGVWREVLATKFTGKASQGYKRSHRIDLPTAKKNWTIRVRRLTANKDSEMVGDRMTIDALTEVLDAKLRYPCTALIGLRFNAESFNNIPKFAAECHGMIIQVPSNYDPVGRTYTGLWDGTFKPAYSNNPAWIYYDLCTARRYALGDRLIGHLDKWSLYRVAQYCDEMVDDGRGGREPRYACNVYLQQREDAYKILQNIAGIFHALTYWDGEQIIVDADLPKDVLYTFSRANIIGDFEYSGTANYARHTQVKVAWDDPDNEYKTTYEVVPDLQAIAKYGVKTLDMSAFGCTSQAQAIRLGKWALLSEALETQTVTFSVGLDGYLPHVGSVIAVSDHVLAGRDNGGRVQAIDGNVITLDRAITKSLASGDLLMINGNDGVSETRTITAINGNKITVQTAFERAEVDAVWAMDSADLQTLKLRVMSIVQSEPAKFTITGVEYNPDKFVAAEIDIRAQPKPVSIIPTAVISAPETVTISQSVRVEQGVSITKLSIDWSQVIGAVAYRVEWRTDDNAWIALLKTASQTIDIDNVYSGNYQARVRAIDAFDNESLATSSQITTITGKVGKPPRLARLTATGKLFGMELAWIFNTGSTDTNYTEIQVSPDGRSNIATLGQFAYPTNSHTITGLQGNLRQFYRARIVDKLGNVSDWTAWASGTTSADAGKVLDILSGQISQSHLDQSLRAPIAKIPTLESGISKINVDLPKINQSIADERTRINSINQQLPTLNQNIANAQSTLNTAVANIDAEKKRITSAIVDINTLKQSNDAKTQELLNLTQTVGGHTSSIRDLGVTTGNLSQRYQQLKTTSDQHNTEIATIKQTAQNQAIEHSRLSAKFDSLEVGGRNLVIKSGDLGAWSNFVRSSMSQTDSTQYKTPVLRVLCTDDSWYAQKSAQSTHHIKQGESYVLSFFVKSNSSLNNTFVYGDNNIRQRLITSSTVLDETWQYIKVAFVASQDTQNIGVIIGGHGIANQSYVEFAEVKLERGTIATDWTPAPEDLQADIDSKASLASLDEFKQAQADKDGATA